MPLRGRLEVSRPIGFIPEDRIAEGLIPDLNLAENLTLGLGKDAPWVRGGRIRWDEAHRRTAELLEEFGIVAAGPKARASALSGGNQQKLIVARELSRNPAVIVAENPTRGLDIVAARAIHDRLRAAAAQGAAVLFHSTDLDEVLELGQRIVVAVRGSVIEAPDNSSRAEIGAMMLGGVG
jgi:simple sugar transport system ATP-binding protein